MLEFRDLGGLASGQRNPGGHGIITSRFRYRLIM